MTTPKAETAIGPDPKIARLIYASLDEHFDEVRRLYRSGWSDERIAKEIETSPVIVSRIRAAAYGELAEDPKITALRDDLELIRMEVEENVAKAIAVANKAADDAREAIRKMQETLARAGVDHHKAAG